MNKIDPDKVVLGAKVVGTAVKETAKNAVKPENLPYTALSLGTYAVCSGLTALVAPIVVPWAVRKFVENRKK